MKWLCLFGLLLAGVGSARGEDVPVYAGDEIVVTASRRPETVKNTLQDVTIITAEEISQAGQKTLGEILQAQPGVEVASNGGPGQPTSVFLRGTNSTHVLVLVDGVRLNSATTGTTAFENIPPGEIERIEIVRGPTSSLYGSDAIGGVIQIFTKSAKGPPKLNISAGFGGYDTQIYIGGIGGRVADTQFSLQAGYTDSAGFSATNPRVDAPGTPPAFQTFNPDRDGYRNHNLNIRLAQFFGADHEIGLTAFESEGATHFDAGPFTDDVNRQRLGAYSAYSRDRFTRNWESHLKLSQGVDHLASTGAFPGTFGTDQYQFLWQNDLSFNANRLTLGAEHLNQRVTSDTQYAKTQRSVDSVFAGYRVDAGNHSFQANARDDHNSQFGSDNTGAFAYGYRLSPALRVGASAGTAFHAPTFNDLYFPGFANPNLKPERSRNREFSLNYDYGRQHLGMVYFDDRISDLIALDPTFTPVNVNQAHIEGSTLSYGGELAGLAIKAQYTSQRPVDEASGNILARRARDYASLSIGKSVGPWRVGGELIASGARFDSLANSPDSRLGGYGIVNLTAAYTFNKHLSVNARFDNVLDKNYELAKGFNTPGANLFIGMRYQ